MVDPRCITRYKAWGWGRWLALVLCCLASMPSLAGLSVYTSWSSLPPTTTANQRTIDFDTNTLASEQTAGKITYSKSEGASTCVLFICTSAGSVSYTSSSSLTGFSGKVASLTSGTTGNSTSVTINFTNPTAYVGLLWGVEFNAESTMAVNLTLVDNSVVTLKNCSSTSSAQCIGKYVSSNWLANIYNLLLGWILGDSVTYYPVYMQYQPDNGVKIKSMQIVVNNCAGCGFLSSNTSQDLKVDYITYVDTSVVPHHLEVSTPSATTALNSAPTFTIKACGDASCTLPYTSGVSGTFAVSGVTASPASVAFSIPAGASSTTVSPTMTAVGTATIALSSYTPTPSNTPKVFCGMGVAAASGNSCNLAVVAPGPHHMELTTTSSSTLTCQPVTYAIKACADAACSTGYTGGVTGTFNLAGGSQAFTIASGSALTSVSAYATTVGSTVVASLSGLSATPSATPPVYCGVGGAAASSGGSCGISVLAAGLLISVPNHVADASTTMTVSAVSSTNNSNVCTPTFVNTSKQVTFKCAYANPTSGTLPVRLGGAALNAANNALASCDASGRALTLSFNASGVASTTLQYADVGQMVVSGSYAGSGADAALTLTGNAGFIAMPKLVVSSATTPPIKAGADFSATVQIRNNSGAYPPNFGKETPAATVSVSLSKSQPTGTGSAAGTFTGTGIVALGNTGDATRTMTWSEVGQVDMTVGLPGGTYLGVASSALTDTRSVGPFIPDRFVLSDIANTCNGFTFSGQPVPLKITAVNTSGGTTLNYDGTTDTSPNQAKAVKLSKSGSSPNALDRWSIATLPIGSFVKGVASVPTTATVPLTFEYQVKESPPATVGLVVTEDGGNGVTNAVVPTLSIRSGRLRLFNKFGSEKQSMTMSVQSQYWADKAWVINAKDDGASCTKIRLSALSLSGYKTNVGVSTNAWTTTASTSTVNNNGKYATTVALAPAMAFSNGQSEFILSAPTPPDAQGHTPTGTVEVALNLGPSSTTTDASCLSSHGATTGAGVPWLRSRNGNCSTAFDRDPSARATFGVYSPETTRTIYGRELY